MSRAQFKVLVIVWMLLGACPRCEVRAEEPVKRFLERIRQERLYEVGLKYLEILEQKNRLPAGMKEDLPLEKVSLLKASLATAQKPQLREERLDLIEKTLQGFLDAYPDHPRRSEAQTSFGDLLRERAFSALEESKKLTDNEKVTKLRESARASFASSVQLYTKIVEELRPKLEQLAGDRAKSQEQIELRDALRDDYRTAEIIHAKTLEDISQTFEANSPSWKQALEAAEKKFNDIIDKTTGAKEAGRRILCFLYRAGIQAKLGKSKEARESFTRVADINEGGIFREWKTEAVTGLLQLDRAEGKWEPAIQRGTDLLKMMTSKERAAQHWIDFQLAFAETRIAYGATLNKSDAAFKNNRREAREILLDLLKLNGPHVEKTNQLLVDLGYDAVAKEEEKLPEPKSFDEAIAQAKSRLERIQNSQRTIPILRQQGTSDEEVAKMEAEIDRDKSQAIQLFLTAIRFYRNSDPREGLLDAQYYLCDLYRTTKQYWQCVAVAQAVMRANKGGEKSVRCGRFALEALSNLISKSAPEEQISLLPSLERLARDLISTAPESDAGGKAVELLVKLALIHGKYEEAERYLAMSENQSSSGKSLFGQVLWRDYQVRSIENRKNNRQDTAEDLALRQKAEQYLQTAWDSMPSDRVESIFISGANALTNLYLTSNRLDDALRILNDPNKGTLQFIGGDAKLEAKDQLETHRLQLQAMVQNAGRPGGSPLQAKQVTDICDRIKELAGGDEPSLTRTFQSLTASIAAKIDTAGTPEEQNRLGEAMGLLVQQLVASTSDLGVLDSAGKAMVRLATSLSKFSSLADQSKAMMGIADAAYTKIGSKSDEEILAADRNPDEFARSLALARSGAGKYEDAHRVFVKLIQKHPRNVTYQVDAAKNLQDWSGGRSIELLEKAWRGTEPGSENQNLVWGWNKISQATANRDDRKEIFFESRYNLALCQRWIGMAQSEPAAKKKSLNDAMKVIRATKVLNPTLGTPEFKAKFERLEAELQNDLRQ